MRRKKGNPHARLVELGAKGACRSEHMLAGSGQSVAYYYTFSFLVN